MAVTPSTMLPLSTTAPEFTLLDTVSSDPISLSTYRAGKPVLIAFICNHCPYVIHIRAALAKLASAAQSRGVAILAISSNDPERYPDDAPKKMTAEAKSAGYTFPYLFDSDQKVAKSYRAACTPDFFLFDASGKLFYRGQFDSSRPNSGKPATGADLQSAIDSLLAHKPAPAQQLPSIGCNIKWKPGNEPDYF